MANDRSEKKIDFSPISIYRVIVLIVITLVCYGSAFFIPILFLYSIATMLDFAYLTNIFIFSLSIGVGFLLFVFSTIILSSMCIFIFGARYGEGEFGTTIKDSIAFKFALIYALYFPTYKLIGIFNLPPIKVLFLKMVGCKIGKNVVLAADEWVFDPYVTEIGDNTTIGARSMILGHIGEAGRLIIKKVQIGKNCLIGGDCFIMPGAIIDDDVILGAKSLVLKNQHLRKGKRYAGVPAREITTQDTTT